MIFPGLLKTPAWLMNNGTCSNTLWPARGLICPMQSAKFTPVFQDHLPAGT